MRFKDITGQRFGRLLATQNYLEKKWEFICDCGNTKYINKDHVRRGSITSCGCYMKECISTRRKTHGETANPLCHVWNAMKARCYNKNNIAYPSYGGRGITYCDRWLESNGVGLLNFLEDMGECPKGMSLDRINNNGNYEPSNCKWSTKQQQSFNKRKSKFSDSTKTGVTKASNNSWRVSFGDITEYHKSFERAVEVRKSYELEYIGFYLDH